MWSVLLSVAALFLGVWMVPFARRVPVWFSAIDGFVLAGITGLVAFTLLPESLTEGGIFAIAALICGSFVPRFLEHRETPRADVEHTPWIVVLAVSGLAIHGFIDGTAFAGSAHPEGAEHEILGLAVLLHRLPVGLALGMLWGGGKARASWGAAVVVACATFGGYWAGMETLPALGHQGLAVFQAFVVGTLIHVIFAHSPLTSAMRTGRTRLFGGLGALLGLCAVVWAIREHPIPAHCSQELAMIESVFGLFLKISPAIVAMMFVWGAAVAVLPRWQIRGSDSPLKQALVGVFMGWSLPVASVGVQARYGKLMRRGGPKFAGLAFLLAAPTASIEVLWISWPLLGWPGTLIRVVSALLFAGLLALVAAGFLNTPTQKNDHPFHEPRDPALSRWKLGFFQGPAELVSHLFPWLTGGLLVAGCANAALHEGALVGIPAVFQVFLAVAAATPFYFCPVGFTPVMAVLVAKGLSVGSAIAMLFVGPIVGGVTHREWVALHGRPVALGLQTAVVAGALMMGVAIDQVWLGIGFQIPELVTSGAADWRWSSPEVIAASVLGVVGCASLLQHGPRAWVDQLYGPFVGGESCELHHHDHAHH